MARLGLTRRAALAFAASTLLGLANAISHGTYLLAALALIAVALAALSIAFGSAARGPQDQDLAGREHVVLFFVLVAMPAVAFLDPKVLAHAKDPWLIGRAGEVVALLLVLSYAPFLGARREPAWLGPLRFGSFALVVVVCGASVLKSSPDPGIDVWTIQMRGAEALLRGENPYVTVTVPDTDPEATFSVPYVYPPTALYAGVLSLLAFGDVRGLPIVWILVTGAALRSITKRDELAPTIVKDAPALLVWLTPLLYLVIERAWLDPLQLALIACGVAAFVAERETTAAVLLGVASSSKQSMFWLVPLAALSLGLRPRQWVVFVVAAGLPVLPFVIWNLGALKYANFDFMTSLAPRSDALAVAVFVQRTFGATFPHSIAFVLAAGIVAVACARLRGPAGFSLAVALCYLAFFVFNRWAFANYYFLVTGLSALAAATAFRARAA